MNIYSYKEGKDTNYKKKKCNGIKCGICKVDVDNLLFLPLNKVFDTVVCYWW